jgi:hypothetical protein
MAFYWVYSSPAESQQAPFLQQPLFEGKRKLMKIKTLLAKAEACKTDVDAASLMDTLATSFGEAKPLAHLPISNRYAYLEDGTPFISFEVCRLMNRHYGMMIRPEIRDNKLTVLVVIHYMKDGLGLNSKSWDVASGTDETVIEADSNASVAMLAKQAAALAIDKHRALIVSVGVSEDMAKLAARKSWNS